MMPVGVQVCFFVWIPAFARNDGILPLCGQFFPCGLRGWCGDEF